MTEIAYHIVRRPRRKTACIVIRPDNRIEVLAPVGLSDSHIKAWVSSKQAWIERKLHFNTHTRSQPEPRRFAEDEIFTLLGRAYTLSVQTSTRLRTEIHEDRLICRTPAPQQTAALRKQITRWYQQYAQEHLQQRVMFYARLSGLKPLLVGIKNYRSRWGTCHIDGRIYFNWRIIMAPPHVSDYVVVHELCHLHQHNHSPAYWQKVASVMPDYRTAKAWLKLNGLSLDL